MPAIRWRKTCDSGCGRSGGEHVEQAGDFADARGAEQGAHRTARDLARHGAQHQRLSIGAVRLLSHFVVGVLRGEVEFTQMTQRKNPFHLRVALELLQNGIRPPGLDHDLR